MQFTKYLLGDNGHTAPELHACIFCLTAVQFQSCRRLGPKNKLKRPVAQGVVGCSNIEQMVWQTQSQPRILVQKLEIRCKL